MITTGRRGILHDMKKGLLVVVSGPSGVGKGSVCKRIWEEHPEIKHSVSVTTRTMRPIEKDGVNYFFRTREEFKKMIEADELLEWAEYVGNYYGTPRKFVMENVEKGQDVLLEIEVQGAAKIREKFPECLLIFLSAPSMEELEKRIRGRGTETSDTIDHRISRGKDEMALAGNYDYVVINDNIQRAADEVYSIIESEHQKRN